MAFRKLLRFVEIQITVFQSDKIEKASRRVVGRRVPVCGAAKPGTNPSSFRRRCNTSSDGTSLSIDSFGPIHLFNEGHSGKEFAIRPVEHVEVAVTVCFYQKLARLPRIDGVDKTRCFCGVLA